MNQALVASTSKAETGGQGMVVGTFMLGFFVNLALSSMIMYLKSLQMIIHLPLMHILVPPNVSVFFAKIIPVVSFDVLDPAWTTELVLEFDDPVHRDSEDMILDQMADLGYETHNSIYNLGSLVIFLVFYIAKCVVYLGLVLLSYLRNKKVLALR